MNFVPGHAEIKLPPLEVAQSPYWAQFHVERGIGERCLMKTTTYFSDIIRQLPEEADGFTLGTQVDITSNTDTQTFLKPTGIIYVPANRCAFASLKEVENSNPLVLDLMLQRGLTTALKLTNGHLSYDPNLVHIVK